MEQGPPITFQQNSQTHLLKTGGPNPQQPRPKELAKLKKKKGKKKKVKDFPKRMVQKR